MKPEVLGARLKQDGPDPGAHDKEPFRDQTARRLTTGRLETWVPGGDALEAVMSSNTRFLTAVRAERSAWSRGCWRTSLPACPTAARSTPAGQKTGSARLV